MGSITDCTWKFIRTEWRCSIIWTTTILDTNISYWYWILAFIKWNESMACLKNVKFCKWCSYRWSRGSKELLLWQIQKCWSECWKFGQYLHKCWKDIMWNQILPRELNNLRVRILRVPTAKWSRKSSYFTYSKCFNLYRFHCPDGTKGEYVFIQKHGSGFLHINHVKVFAEIPRAGSS